MEGGLTEPGRALRQEGRHRSAPQTHVVGLKKLLGSEALAGVRLALTPEVGGRADAEAVSSALPPWQCWTQGTPAQQESTAGSQGRVSRLWAWVLLGTGSVELGRF